MRLNVDGQEGMRRAALTLHALHAADRDWLLAQLPAPGREALVGLLRDLRELDIPRDAEVIRAALREASSAATLPREEGRALCLALVEESSALQGLLLATLSEAERRAVLVHWPREVLIRPDAATEPVWTEAFRAALLQSWREAAAARGAPA